MKAFTADKSKFAKMMISIFDSVESIVASILSQYHNVFKRLLPQDCQNQQLFCVELNQKLINS